MTVRRLLRGTGACFLAWAALSCMVPSRAADAGSSGVVYLSTVPAVAGVQLKVGSALTTTDGNGRASAQVPDLNGIASTVALAADRLDGRTTVAISRVVPAPHIIAHVSNLTIGLDLSSRVRLHVGGGSAGVRPGTVRSVRLHSITGQTITVDPRRQHTVTLQSRIARLEHNTLTTQHVTWSVDKITAGSGVALTTATPRFDPLSRPVWNLVLRPVHGVVEVDTVPATPGVVFLLEGAAFTTDKNGRAFAPVSDLNDVDERLRLDTPVAGSDSVSLMEIRKLPPLAAYHRRLLAALTIRRPVSLHFVDMNGRPIDPNRISEVRLTGGGSVVQLTGADARSPVMLTSSVATQVNRVWVSRSITYAVEAVQLDGGGAVFAGQQRFDPNAALTWPVKLAVFNLSVTVHDALFGHRIESQMLITRPDGKTYAVQIGSGVPTRLGSMVRGMYGLTVVSAVFGGHTQTLVSRNDAIDLRVITLLDVVVLVVAGLLIVVATMALGNWMARRRRSSTVLSRHWRSHRRVSRLDVEHAAAREEVTQDP